MVTRFVDGKELEAAGRYLAYLYNQYRVANDEYADYGKGYAEGKLDGAIDIMLYLGLITRVEKEKLNRRFEKNES